MTRRVPDNTLMITFDHCQYSVPATLLGQSVWVRHHSGSDEVIVCALDAGPSEVARHARTTRVSRPSMTPISPGITPKMPGDY